MCLRMLALGQRHVLTDAVLSRRRAFADARPQTTLRVCRCTPQTKPRASPIPTPRSDNSTRPPMVRSNNAARLPMLRPDSAMWCLLPDAAPHTMCTCSPMPRSDNVTCPLTRTRRRHPASTDARPETTSHVHRGCAQRMPRARRYSPSDNATFPPMCALR